MPKNKPRRKSLAKIKESLAVPFRMTDDGVDIEIISDRYVNVDGCTEIKEYSDTVAIFAGKNMTAVVTGENIELFTFADGRVRAAGRILKVEIVREA